MPTDCVQLGIQMEDKAAECADLALVKQLAIEDSDECELEYLDMVLVWELCCQQGGAAAATASTGFTPTPEHRVMAQAKIEKLRGRDGVLEYFERKLAHAKECVKRLRGE